ncbi:zinc transporter ZIP6-like [Dysidea avara]|uniref:zinc transporter ZIP6-like n=1 Tax=Dysidea avara TaxID=196820 RepID=UPI00331D1F1B
MEQHLNDSSDDHDNDFDDHDNDFDDHDNATNCSTIYEVCHNLILEIGLTTEACLAGNDSSNTVSEDTHSDISDSEAYGYGFLSTVIISATSLLGVITIIFSYKSQASKYLLSILVAIGVSTLVSDAVLHLIPHAFGTYEEEEAGDGHDHSSKGEHNHDRTVIWRGCCVLAGIFIFYMFEFVMGIVKKRMEKPKQMDDSGKAIELNDSTKRGTLHKADTSSTSSHDECLNLDMDGHPAYFNRHQGFCHGITSVAWMIILGDGIHNFADGVAIGASFTSSLGVGVSTSLAVLFHELPHEFGDFAILLSSGMKWYVALMYNFLSAITAIIGMFVGVAIGNSEEDATPWILSITAGIFLYVALVDLLPALLEVLNNCKDRRSLIIYITCHLTGFFIGFAILLLIAIYEEDINNLVD